MFFFVVIDDDGNDVDCGEMYANAIAAVVCANNAPCSNASERPVV